MGNTTDTPANSLMKVIQKQYEEVRQDARGIVLMNKNDQNTYLLREYTYANQMAFKNKEKQLQEQIKQGPKEYIVSPVKVQSRIFNTFCSTSYKIYAIFEYPQVTLKEEIVARQKQSKNFEEGQLWSILQSCTNALSELKPLVSLNTSEIFINPDGNIKIIHDDLIDENYRAVISEQINYAPEKLKNFNRNDSQLSLKKQSIFSMGMTMLEAAQLAEVSTCYNYNDGVFIEANMIDMLEYLSEKYSPQFVETLGNILEPNPNRRASLMEVQKSLDNFWNAEESQQQSENNFDQSKGNTELAEKNEISQLHPNPLNERSMNQQNIEKQKPSARKYVQDKQNYVAMPQKLPNYKLQENTVARPEQIIPETPKNPPTVSQNTLFTDPKLLEMIKKDLEDINKLKNSAFYETSKYTFMYPQTQSILNSIKNFQTEPKPSTAPIQQFNKINLESSRQIQQSSRRISELTPTTMMMKKKKDNDLVFTVQSYEDGRRYEGTTLNGKKHGKGKLMFEDGAYYEGQFKEDKMNGRGILFYNENNPAYDGQWSNDQFHGFGILFNEYPQQLTCEYDFHEMCEVEDYWVKYQGQFYLDNKHGNGVLYLTNGQVFEGEFSDDSVNGRGRYTCMSGEVIQGEWRNNTLVTIQGQ